LVETFPEETAPKYLLRDRDAIYGDVFARRVKGMGIHEVLIAPRAPWQNPFAERVIGSIRRECLDHVIVFSERHLRRLLRRYLAYYNATRPHQALHSDSPMHVKCSRQPPGESSRRRRSADFITVISASPDPVRFVCHLRRRPRECWRCCSYSRCPSVLLPQFSSEATRGRAARPPH